MMQPPTHTEIGQRPSSYNHCRRAVSEYSQTRVRPSSRRTRSGPPISSITSAFVIGTESLSSFDSDLTMVYATPQPANVRGTATRKRIRRQETKPHDASSNRSDIASRVPPGCKDPQATVKLEEPS